MNHDKVCITGATGFLGRWVTDELLRSGHQVRTLVRPGTEPLNLEGLDCEIVRGELQLADLERAFDGCDAVIHLAALVSFRRKDDPALQRINVDGTAQVVAACERQGVRRLLHCSSVAAVGLSRGEALADEDTPYDLDRFGVGYLSTKRRSEELVLSHQGSLEVIVVNPAALFGPGDRRPDAYESLRRIRDKGLQIRPPGGLCVADVRDVARGHRLALEQGRPGRRYILGGENLSGDELAEALCRPFGRRVPKLRPPRALLAGVAGLLAVVDRLPFVDSPWPGGILRLAGETFRYSSARAESELGYSCRPFEQTIGDVASELLTPR